MDKRMEVFLCQYRRSHFRMGCTCMFIIRRTAVQFLATKFYLQNIGQLEDAQVPFTRIKPTNMRTVFNRRQVYPIPYCTYISLERAKEYGCRLLTSFAAKD